MAKYNVAVQLSGNDGNAFAIMGAVKSALKKAGASKEELEQYLADSMSGDYDFSSNCYPPIPKVMIPVAIEAIDAYWEEDYAKVIQLPEGVEFRNGENWVLASQAIESLRLDAWLSEIYWTDEDEEDE
jgi:preprotein translocase subunit SecA